jgi:hypothetical protein
MKVWYQAPCRAFILVWAPVLAKFARLECLSPALALQVAQHAPSMPTLGMIMPTHPSQTLPQPQMTMLQIVNAISDILVL